MCDEAIDVSSAALKLVPNWFATSKMIKKLYTNFVRRCWFTFFDEDSGDAIVFCNEIGILSFY